MRTFGGFRSDDRFFYGEIRGDEVQVLRNPFWNDIKRTGESVRLTNVVMNDLRCGLRHKGELRQGTGACRVIYAVAQILAFASQSLPLLPVDVILTGTPAGVGPIHAGDGLAATFDGWPTLRNSVATA